MKTEQQHKPSASPVCLITGDAAISTCHHNKQHTTTTTTTASSRPLVWLPYPPRCMMRVPRSTTAHIPAIGKRLRWFTILLFLMPLMMYLWTTKATRHRRHTDPEPSRAKPSPLLPKSRRTCTASGHVVQRPSCSCCRSSLTSLRTTPVLVFVHAARMRESNSRHRARHCVSALASRTTPSHNKHTTHKHTDAAANPRAREPQGSRTLPPKRGIHHATEQSTKLYIGD